jgi:hypothetical protein
MHPIWQHGVEIAADRAAGEAVDGHIAADFIIL